MNKDLERQIEAEKQEKSAEAKRLAEMRNAGPSTEEKDLERTVGAEKTHKKGERNTSIAFRKG